jgi:hypothetical protein
MKFTRACSAGRAAESQLSCEQCRRFAPGLMQRLRDEHALSLRFASGSSISEHGADGPAISPGVADDRSRRDRSLGATQRALRRAATRRRSALRPRRRPRGARPRFPAHARRSRRPAGWLRSRCSRAFATSCAVRAWSSAAWLCTRRRTRSPITLQVEPGLGEVGARCGPVGLDHGNFLGALAGGEVAEPRLGFGDAVRVLPPARSAHRRCPG